MLARDGPELLRDGLGASLWHVEEEALELRGGKALSRPLLGTQVSHSRTLAAAAASPAQKTSLVEI